MYTAIVTGASSGIGRATVKALSSKYPNLTIIGTCRNPQTLTDPLPDVHYCALDLTDPESVSRCAQEILRLGTPRILVNNAGESQSGPLEGLPIDKIEELFRTNVFGHLQLTQALLPAMRAEKAGSIVMVGSMLGSFPLAYRSSYVASKAAMKAFAFAARRELSPFGIGICCVEPGSINTGISTRRTKYADPNGPYYEEFSAMLEALDSNERGGISAEKVAATILKAVAAEKPKPLYAVGSMAPLPFYLQRILPIDAMHAIIHRKHGLD